MANGLLGQIAAGGGGTNVLGGIQQGIGVQQGLLGLEAAGAARQQRQQDAQTKKLRGDLLAKSFEGRLVDDSKLDDFARRDPAGFEQIMGTLGIPLDERGRFKNLVGTSQVVSTLLTKGLIPEAKNVLTNKKETMNALGIETPKIDEQLALLETNPEEVAANTAALTQAGIEAGFLTDPGEAKRKTKQSQINVLRKNVDDFGKDLRIAENSIARVRVLAENPSPAGDMSLLFNFMKINDPGAIVTEGDIASIKQVGAANERIVGLYNAAVNGKSLTVTQRQDFFDTAERLFNAQAEISDERLAEILDKGIEDNIKGVEILGQKALDNFNERVSIRETAQAQAGFGPGNLSAAELTTQQANQLSIPELERLREQVTAQEGG